MTKLPQLFKVKFDYEKWRKVYNEVEDIDREYIKHNILVSVFPYTDEEVTALRTVLKKYDFGEVLDVTSSYVFMETMAPAAYDGFSTMEISRNEECSEVLIRDKPVRIVATEHRDVKWQQGRYGSGMYYFKEIVDE